MKAKNWLGSLFARRAAKTQPPAPAAGQPERLDAELPTTSPFIFPPEMSAPTSGEAASEPSAVPMPEPEPPAATFPDVNTAPLFADADEPPALMPEPDAEPEAPDQGPSLAERAESALLKEVFLARLRAQAVSCRLRLESLEDKPQGDRERRLALIQARVMNERTANVEAAYQETLACLEEVLRFLTRMAAGDEESRAAKIRDDLIHNATADEAETFLDECGEGDRSGPKLAAKAGFLSGRLAEWRADFPAALHRYGRALRFDPDNIAYLRAAGNMAQLLGQYDLAAKWRTSLARLVKQQPGADPAEAALAQRDLAYTMLKAGRYDDAAPLYKNAMAVIAEELGSNHPEMAAAWFQLGEMQESRGTFEQAHELYQRALKMLESNLGLIDPRLCPPLEKLAALSLRFGRDQEALSHYRKLVAVQEKNLPSDHPSLAESLTALADVYARRGEFAQAEQCCIRALRVYEALHEREHPTVAALLAQLSWFCLQQGKAEEAARYQQAAEAVHAALGGDGAAEDDED